MFWVCTKARLQTLHLIEMADISVSDTHICLSLDLFSSHLNQEAFHRLPAHLCAPFHWLLGLEGLLWRTVGRQGLAGRVLHHTAIRIQERLTWNTRTNVQTLILYHLHSTLTDNTLHAYQLHFPSVSADLILVQVNILMPVNDNCPTGIRDMIHKPIGYKFMTRLPHKLWSWPRGWNYNPGHSNELNISWK